jgi:hypothetical protein
LKEQQTMVRAKLAVLSICTLLLVSVYGSQIKDSIFNRLDSELDASQTFQKPIYTFLFNHFSCCGCCGNILDNGNGEIGIDDNRLLNNPQRVKSNRELTSEDKKKINNNIRRNKKKCGFKE